jgi:hypothetical protein
MLLFQAPTPAPPQGVPPAPPASPITIDLSERIRQTVEAALQRAALDGVPASRRGELAREEARRIADEARAQIDALRAEMQEARAGTSTVLQIPPWANNDIPPQVVPIVTSFFAMFAVIIVGLPLARAFARRMDRKGTVSARGEEVAPRLDRIEQAVEAVAIEVERISENQRYATKVLNEMRALPSPSPVDAWPGGAREAERVPRAAPDRGRP